MKEESVAFQAVEFGPYWLIGRQTTVGQGKTAAPFVKTFRTDGSMQQLQALEGRVSPDGDLIIWMGEYDAQAKTFVEIPGILAQPGCEVPEGFAVRELPECLMGICTIRGKTRSLSRGAHGKLVRLMKEAGYEPDYSLGFSMEYYSHEKYELKNEIYEFAYYLPCRKA